MAISSEATTVSDNGADNGLTSINQVQPGVIGRECKKGRGSVNVNQNGGNPPWEGKGSSRSSWAIRETALFEIKEKKKEVYSVVITI